MNITVVIPLYNKADTIERALLSVLRQSYQPKEIIIVDDGSSDTSIEKINPYRDKIQIIQQENSGVSVARNTGITHAKGEWIAFLDADDEWKDDFLSSIFILHQKYPNAKVLATAYETTFDNTTFKKLKLYKTLFEGSNGIIDNYFEIAAISSPPICSSAVVISKEALISIGGFIAGLEAGEDILTWAKLASEFSVGYELTSLSVIHLSAAHIFESKPSRIPDNKNIVGKQLELIYRKKPTPGLKKYIGLWYKMRASIYLCLGENKNALKSIFFSFRYYFNWKLLVYIYLIFFPVKIRLKVFQSFAK